jgi:hypothetical protein
MNHFKLGIPLNYIRVCCHLVMFFIVSYMLLLSEICLFQELPLLGRNLWTLGILMFGAVEEVV